MVAKKTEIAKRASDVLRLLKREYPVAICELTHESAFQLLAATASFAGVGYASKSAGVTMFTRTSVHCAERIVAGETCSRRSFACRAVGALNWLLSNEGKKLDWHGESSDVAIWWRGAT